MQLTNTISFFTKDDKETALLCDDDGNNYALQDGEIVEKSPDWAFFDGDYLSQIETVTYINPDCFYYYDNKEYLTEVLDISEEIYNKLHDYIKHYERKYRRFYK